MIDRKTLLEKLTKLDARATAAPWITQEENEAEAETEMSLMGPMGAEEFDQLTLNYTMSTPNAQLLCFLRNAVPDILSALQRLEELEKKP